MENVLFFLSLHFIPPSSFVFVCWYGTTTTNEPKLIQSSFYFSLYYSMGFSKGPNKKQTNRRQKKKCLKNRRYSGSQLRVQQMNFFPTSEVNPIQFFIIFESLKVTPAHSWTHIHNTFIQGKAKKISNSRNKWNETTNE